MTTNRRPLVALLLVTAAAAACSSSSTGTGTGTGTSDGGSGTGDGGGGLTPKAGLGGCATSDYADHTAAGDPRTITFPMGLPEQQYKPPCVTIKAGQSVTWSGGDFGVHPLTPINGSDSPNPIKTVTSGTSPVTYAFPAAGTYGFQCAEHPTVMHGAIFVVP